MSQLLKCHSCRKLRDCEPLSDLPHLKEIYVCQGCRERGDAQMEAARQKGRYRPDDQKYRRQS